MDDDALDNIVDRLLDVRTGRPGKQVALSETEVGCSVASWRRVLGTEWWLALLVLGWSSRSDGRQRSQTDAPADPAAVPHCQGDFHESAKPAGTGGPH